MCGIYGIVSLSGAKTPDPEQVRRMAAATVHRGPDDEGAYFEKRIAFGMRRLSIIDVDGGHQPLSNRAKTVWVICNGEIYNFRELRSELLDRGHEFTSSSDSEVIVHAYVEYGDRFVTRLDGMFAFALWDAERGRLVIGRDRLGIKPLYYLDDGERLIFASEAKAILRVSGVTAELDPVGLHHYLSLGYVPSPCSMFKGIRKLPPASTMIVEQGKTRIENYWSLPDTIDESHDEREWIAELHARLEKAVVSQMVSDVPIGAFLSGGVDSSAVVAFMAKHSDQPIRTYSIGFDTTGAGKLYNELPYARQISDRFGTVHKEILVRPDVVELLPKLLWQMDEPVADSAFITTFLVAEFARKDVTVILSGVGGDELFGGYSRYLSEHFGRYYRMIPKAIRDSVVQPLARRLPADRHSSLLNLSRLVRAFLLSSDLPLEPRYRNFVGVFRDEDLSRLLLEWKGIGTDALTDAFASSYNGDSIRTLFEVDLRTQLPDDLLLLTDRMTMATSLECRVPFLDHELVEFAARMPSTLKIRGRKLKYVLKKALAGILPENILHRQKRGFGAPMGAWIRGELAPLVKHLLSAESVEQRALLDPEIVATTIAAHEARREDHTDHLLALINLELWCRMYLDGQSPQELTSQIRNELKQ